MKVFLDSIGCRLNQSEIELFAKEFRQAGQTLVPRPEDADIVVINTCTVTKEAASDSRQKIRQAARSGAKDITLTGCLATLDQEATLNLPGVSRIIANQRKELLVQEILQQNHFEFEKEPVAREPIPGLRARTRAFIKVQDGCDNHCTFCITRIARGPSRSRQVPDIIDDIAYAIRGSAREIVLSGAQLGAWGKDLIPKMSLAQLIAILLEKMDIPRLRLSSLEPWDVTHELISLWNDPRLCRHFHLPLQSGSESTLRRMARGTDPVSYQSMIIEIKESIPDVAITTDIIVGFPGETERDFDENLEFIGRVGFAGGHVFTYSERPGTPAVKFPDSVPMVIRKDRNAKVRALFADYSERFKQTYLGKTVSVLWESVSEVTSQGWQLTGLTDNYLKIYALASEPLLNMISSVNLFCLYKDGIQGEITGGQKTLR
jgi:threonylcarbamoyladenosine tRNA methylthiotransferase MtaB